MTTTTWALPRVLRDRNAALYLTGAVVSGFGTSALWLVSGVWVKDLTGSDGLAALCMLAMWAPTLAGPLLGTLADRVRRKPLLIGANLLLAALLLTLFTVDSPARLWLLFAVLFVYGAAGVVHDAAESALVASAVPASLLGDFNGLRMTASEGMKLLAPLAGAGVYAAYGGASVALVDAGTFVVATCLYACLRVRESRPEPPPGGWRTQTAEGARFLWAHPRLRPRPGRRQHDAVRRAQRGDDLRRHRRPRARPRVRRCAVRRPGRRFGRDRAALGPPPAPARRTPFRRVRHRPDGHRGRSAGDPVRPGGPGLRRGGGAGLPCVLIAALTAVQRETPDALLGRTAATANTLVFTPNVIGLAVGAALVELLDVQLLLAVLGPAWLLTALPLLQRAASASRTAAKSPSDANPA